jgi:GNAT superfamily N-acetyltransferase
MFPANGYYDVPPGKIAAIVTSLEMRTRPVLRPAHADPAWTLRPIARAETDWFRAVYRHVGQNWLWFSRLQMADAALAALIQHPGMSHYTLHVDGRDEGLIELDTRTEGNCELSFFGVSAKLIGGSAGRWLMNHAIDLAWSRPIERFWVHTCTLDHPNALGFYRRSGFRPYHRQIEIADDPRLAGTLPRNDAPQVPIIE